MKLEQQVTSLELSKRLKELNVSQESLYVWRKNNGMAVGYVEKNSTGRYELSSSTLSTGKEQYSTFTVAELFERLPGASIELEIRFKKMDGVYWSEAWTNEDPKQLNRIEYDHQLMGLNDQNPANSLSKMLIYLLENNLLSTKNRKDTEG